DEFAALHSITSSAATSRPGGTVSPSAFAVLRLSTVSYLVGACTGRSAGFAPRRMRSIYEAVCPNISTWWVVGHKTASRHKYTQRVDCGQAVSGRKRDDKIAMGEGRDIRRQDQTAA